ncbi:MAG TPA: two-component regulator propeller domain-containing protein [Calditrichia bacterium]|nr:two-component regulator propeller domain-containing protein [Calditrichia bacterium]
MFRLLWLLPIPAPRFFRASAGLFRLLIWGLFLSISGALAGPQQFWFRNYNVEDGLSQTTVFDLAQDSSGFIWIATQDGLNRFDGYDFRIYRHLPGDSASISDKLINTLFVAADGTLWIGTNRGLSCYSPETDRFTNFFPGNDLPETRIAPTNSPLLQTGSPEGGNNILSLAEKEPGELWVGTQNGLFIRSEQTGKLAFHENYGNPSQPGNQKFIGKIWRDPGGNMWLGTIGQLTVALAHSTPEQPRFVEIRDAENRPVPRILDMLLDRGGNVWLATVGGLFRISQPDFQEWLAAKKPAPLRFSQPWEGYFSRQGRVAVKLIQTRDGRIWVGSSYGLVILDPQGKALPVEIPVESESTRGLNDSFISAMTMLNSGDLCLGTQTGGIAIMESTPKPFGRLISGNSPELVPGKGVFGIDEDRRGRLWLAFNEDGFASYNRETGHFTPYLIHPEAVNFRIRNRLRAICLDGRDAVWLGSRSGGLFRFRPETGQLDQFAPQPGDSSAFPAPTVFAIANGAKDDLWIGTSGSGLIHASGLDLPKPRFTTFTHDPENPNSLSHNVIYHIFPDQDATLWISTVGGGLVHFDPGNGRFTRFRHDPQDSLSINCDKIRLVNRLSDGRLWVGTDEGFAYLNERAGTFRRYTEKDGLANNVVYGILEDSRHHLWLSTNAGLSRFNPSSGTFTNYDETDGLQSNEFNTGAFLQLRDGLLSFGGIRGLNIFDPDKIVDNTFLPPIVLTDFRVSNENRMSHYRQSEALVLSHDQNTLFFRFAALNYLFPERSRYAYKLEGFDADWQISGKERAAQYTNLPPGEYRFRVRGSNHDGYWNEHGVDFPLIIEQPFWQTWWFALGVISTGILLIWLVHRLRMRQVERVNARLEMEVRRQTRELRLKNADLEQLTRDLVKARDQALEASRMKTEFLQNISHEFRTPMNGIVGFTDLARQGASEKELQIYLDQVRHSAWDLTAIINDILTYTEAESKTLIVCPEVFESKQFFQNLASAYRERAAVKNLSFRLELDRNLPQLLVGDPGKLRHAFGNLLDNAIKFTTRGGVILAVRTRPNPEEGVWLSVAVSDSGMGIPPEKQAVIFEPFRQADGSLTRKYGGTGIGLSTARALVKAMGGDISLQSVPGQGSSFTVSVPLEEAPADRGHGESHGDLRPLKILVAEDQVVNQRLIKRLLEKRGHLVRLAEDGAAAVVYFQSDHYDLVLMDIQMPNKDGLQATAEIRKSEQPIGRHTPIIAVTAHAASQDRERYLAAGMDGYVSKPINPTELFAEIGKVFEG